MLAKEIGVPVPIPSDLLMIGAGIQIAAGAYSAVELLVALGLAVLVGGSIQFLVARSAGRAVVYRVAARVGVSAERLDRAVARLGASGPRTVFVGLNVPGARAAVIPAAGVARLPFAPFTAAMVAGSLVFYAWHVALGYAIGPSAVALLERGSAFVVAGLIALAAVGAVGWLVLRRRARLAGGGALRSWTDAACPACLAITALRRP
ncbi:MAG: VTT domain-containing protein [Chloroflexi bacterium]|nr:VTT domain-containing protein [Chloroflexota bacterium]